VDQQGDGHRVQPLAEEKSKQEDAEKAKIMNALPTFLLETCFWNHLDAGAAPEQTPLFSGLLEEQPLSDVVCGRFGVSPEVALFEIEAARREVE